MIRILADRKLLAVFVVAVMIFTVGFPVVSGNGYGDSVAIVNWPDEGGTYPQVNYATEAVTYNTQGGDGTSAPLKIMAIWETGIEHLNAIDIENHGNIQHIIDYTFDTTNVSILPLSQTVSPGETFTVDVYCVPAQPIKSFELKLSFNSSILQANSVTKGHIFNGFDTFFNPGNINNTDGTIVNIYGLIMESGNVTEPGIFATISFTAEPTFGTSILDIYDVGVTNETGYIPIAVNDGSVKVRVLDIPLVLFNEYPENNSKNIERPPSELNVTVESVFGMEMDLYINWKSHGGEWFTLGSYIEVDNGTYKTTNLKGNDWIWGNTAYTWSVNVTDGTFWTNETYQYTTGGSRYDVNNNGVVNFQDAGLIWIHRTSKVDYDGIYDVNQNGIVNFQDMGLTWVNMD
jgi:hypothetical protein